jgi:MFS transporter, PHS family, inorganic phosphate transporter
MLISLPGIGADYPLSAVICSEFAPRKHRARMLASVFFCQPLGQLLGMMVSLVVITSSRKYLLIDSEACTTDECIRALDRAWRWIVGFGSIPAVVALFFRLTIPESPRYLLDVVGAVKSASMDTQDFYKGDAFGQSQDLMEGGLQAQENISIVQQEHKSSIQGTPPPPSGAAPVRHGPEGLAPIRSSGFGARPSLDPLPSPTIVPTNDELNCIQSRAVTMHTDSSSASVHSAELASPDEQQPPKASWQDAKHFFIEEKNWIYLLATSSTWFLLDVSLTSPFLSLSRKKPTRPVCLLWPRSFRPCYIPQHMAQS